MEWQRFGIIQTMKLWSESETAFNLTKLTSVNTGRSSRDCGKRHLSDSLTSGPFSFCSLLHVTHSCIFWHMVLLSLPILFCWLTSIVVCNAAGKRAGRPSGAWERGVFTLPAVGPAGGRTRGRSGGRHCMSGQSCYVLLGRHFVY